MPTKYEFDAARWCDSMKIAHFRNKDFTTAENFKQTRMEIETLRARLAEVEAQRDGLARLVVAVIPKYHHIEVDDVDGKNWFDMRREALGEE